jgi:hypothetical protein
LLLSISKDEIPFVVMGKYSSYRNSSFHFNKRARKRRSLTAGFLISSLLALTCLLLFTKFWRQKPGEGDLSANDSVAELVSTTGVVLKAKLGRTEWHPISLGARLMQGDLIKTDQFANALVRYANGTVVSIKEKSVFTVGNTGNDALDSAVRSKKDVDQPSDSPESGERSSSPNAAKPEEETPAPNRAKTTDIRPFMKLERIIAFGRSLELVGTVEAGSRLVVNGEIVDIDGEGAFKHFTKPFPASAEKARLVMKVKDLAGRTRSETIIYDFNPHGRNE